MKSKILLAVAVAFAIVAVGCTTPTKTVNDNSHAGMNHNSADQGNMQHSTMQSSPGAINAPYDLQFLDTMIAHHQGAIDMAKPAATKAGHAEIKQLARNIISDQEKEIAQMKEWRSKWFASAPPAVNMEMSGMNDSMRGMDMEKLESLSGNEFDLEFIKQMVPHHRGALAMAKDASNKATKDEIKRLAEGIIKSQEAEIKQMSDWERTWNPGI